MLHFLKERIINNILLKGNIYKKTPIKQKPENNQKDSDRQDKTLQIEFYNNTKRHTFYWHTIFFLLLFIGYNMTKYCSVYGFFTSQHFVVEHLFLTKIKFN